MVDKLSEESFNYHESDLTYVFGVADWESDLRFF